MKAKPLEKLSPQDKKRIGEFVTALNSVDWKPVWESAMNESADEIDEYRLARARSFEIMAYRVFI